MKNLISYKFWLNSNPPDLLPIFFKAFIGVILIFLLVYLIAWMVQRKKKSVYNTVLQSLKTWSLTNFFVGLIILFFNFESIYFLSARFWFIFWGIEIIIWFYFVIKKLKKIPQSISAKIKADEYKKYIPK